MFVVTDIDRERLQRASEIITEEGAQRNGVTLVYINTAGMTDMKNIFCPDRG